MIKPAGAAAQAAQGTHEHVGPLRGLVHFVHGKESGPRGRKIVAMADIASQRGWQVESLDYSASADPAVRLAQLLAACPPPERPLVLVGSSMGGWVAAQAALQLQAKGIFLLAPAVGLANYPGKTPRIPASTTEIVHGWGDDIVPIQHSIDFARDNTCTLHAINGDHRLDQQLDLICNLFDAFLSRLIPS